MIRTLIAAFLSLAALGASAAAQVTATPDQERPRLKAEAVVTGDLVRIGDLVEHAGIVAEVPIFRAPDLGSTGTVSTDAVVKAVRAHALVGLDTGGLHDVEVTRASRTITPKEIEGQVARALATRFTLGKPADVALNFDGGLRPLHVEPDAKGEPQVARIYYDAHSGRFEVTLEIPTGRSSQVPLRLAGRAIATVEVATVAQTIERGAVLRNADVVMERQPRARIERDVITDRAQAVGLAARNTLQAGRLLRAAELMKPQLIKRGEQVTLIYEVPGITLTVRGKAAEGGAKGDVISVLNEQSKHTVQGVISGPGRVVINSGSRQLADNIAPAKPATDGRAR
jgi:flagella basal body P-ring formation protein FlgA